MIKTIAIQGQAASFHDLAARAYYGDNIELVACETFAQTFEALQSEQAERAVVAIENSLYGSINEVYDLLLKHKLWINGEVYLHISQCLLGFQGTTLENIREVYSHPVALAQCEQFLDIHLPESKRFEYHDTAGAAADIKKWGDLKRAAIASQHAAETYGLSILKKEIETHKDNYTRFVVLSKDRIQESQANKTSLVLGIADQMRGIGDRPGALYNVLGAFAKQNINLTKLQSRPLIGRAWHYIFYADVDCGLKQPAMQAALADLEYQRCAVTILGSYRSSRV